jgi:hypothetical protein
MCENGQFELNVDGWAQVGANVITRQLDATTFYGDYVMQVQDDQAGSREYAYYDCDATTGPFGGTTLAGRKYIVVFYFKSTGPDQGFFVRLGDDNASEFATKAYVAVDSWRMGFIEVEFTPGNSEDQLRFEIHPYYPDQVTGIVRVDNIRIREILLDLQLPVPAKYHQEFQKEVQSVNETIDKVRIEHPAGWRYACNLRYTYLTAAEEQVRNLASEGDHMLFFPHEDSDFCQFVRWVGKYDRDYPREKYLGHVGNIPFEGVDLIDTKPSTVINTYLLEESEAVEE